MLDFSQIIRHNRSIKRKANPMSIVYERFTDRDLFYVAADGNYGGEDIIITSFDKFTQRQMDIFEALTDNDRFWYIQALMTGGDVSEFEDDFEL
jgi:hypothetical protein